MITLGYRDWRYFDTVIEKAKIACKNFEMLDTEHFVVNNQTSPMPNGGSKIVKDYMGSAELGANIFRITQTDALLKDKKINNENEACNTHNKVGKAVRETIKKLGGTMPENLPTPEKSIKQLEKEKKKNLKAPKDKKKLKG